MWVFLLLIVLLSFLFAGWAANSWVQAHALCALSGGEWSCAARGWGAVLGYAGFFLGAGVLLGCGLGFLAGMPLERLFTKQRDEKLEKDREQVKAELATLQRERMAVERARCNLANNVQKASFENNQQAWSVAEKLDGENRELAQRTRQLEEKNRQLLGRLQGAQGKAARLAKKHN